MLSFISFGLGDDVTKILPVLLSNERLTDHLSRYLCGAPIKKNLLQYRHSALGQFQPSHPLLRSPKLLRMEPRPPPKRGRRARRSRACFGRKRLP